MKDKLVFLSCTDAGPLIVCTDLGTLAIKNLRFFAFMVHFNPTLSIMHKHHFQPVWVNLFGDHSCNSVFFRFRIPIYFDVRIKIRLFLKIDKKKKNDYDTRL